MNIQELRFGSGTLSKTQRRHRQNARLEHLLVEITLVINKGENSQRPRKTRMKYPHFLTWYKMACGFWSIHFSFSLKDHELQTWKRGEWWWKIFNGWLRDVIHSFHVLKIGLKNTTARAQKVFFYPSFFHLLCPLWILGWELFSKRTFTAFSQIPFNIFWGLDLIEKTKIDWNTIQF